MAKATVKKSKKTRQIVPHGQAHILASFNNTIVSITDEKWNVLTWATGWSAGFKGAREATPVITSYSIHYTKLYEILQLLLLLVGFQGEIYKCSLFVNVFYNLIHLFGKINIGIRLSAL